MKQRRPRVKPLSYFSAAFDDRVTAIARAYASGGYSMKEIGKHFGLHYSYISRIIKRVEEAKEYSS